MAGAMFVGREQWWEHSAFFLTANTNKRDLTLDLDRPDGRELALRLIAQADLVVENYTPRVIETSASAGTSSTRPTRARSWCACPLSA